MIKKDCLYIPDPTEPCIFSRMENSISLEWVCWCLHYKKTGVKSANYPFGVEGILNVDGLLFAEVYNGAIETYNLLKHTLKNHGSEYVLPTEPPSLYVEVERTERTKVISQVWIMDTCIRDNMTPDEALALGIALTRM